MQTEESLDIELYEGADIGYDKFMKKFESVCNQHKFSQSARNDVLKMFASTLPRPNKIFAELPITNMPLVTIKKSSDYTYVFVDLLAQIERIVNRNACYVKKSWSASCSWEFSTDLFSEGELQLVLNTDGAPVFKSRKISIWPIWVQVFNLPPVLRSSLSNLSLLGLWYGTSKPDFNQLLSYVSLELSNLCNSTIEHQKLGRIKLRVRSIICDMPATAYVLCMKQHMGYNSCPHCFIKGYHKNKRMLFKVNKAFILRENDSFKKCGILADKLKQVVSGVKSSTPLNSFLSLPWDCPVDPMHQVFLGTGKVLSKMIISLVKGKLTTLLQGKISNCRVPFDFLHRPKKLSEVKFWKAHDFKLFFFIQAS